MGINKDLLISSLEFCFLHCAYRLPLEKLILLGYEFCGSYRLKRDAVNKGIHSINLREHDNPTQEQSITEQSNSSHPMNEQGFRNDQPLTSVSRMKAFMDKHRELRLMLGFR